MSRNNITKESKIIVIGQLSKLKLQGNQNIAQIQLRHSFNNQFSQILNIDTIKPIKIYSQGNILAFIDQNQEAWLICEPFGSPINLSSFIRKKVSQILIGEKEVILKTKKEYYLLNWGSKKLIDISSLTKISTFSCSKYDSMFGTFLIHNIDQNDIFHYTPERKFENSNRLYLINNSDGITMGYPTFQTIKMATKIKGISVGTYHGLCWDLQGRLYSWGSRSLGLGYGELPSQIIETPRLVDTCKCIISAFAGYHYSLALTTEGQIYEWGIKRQVNQINEELIFTPRLLQFRYFKCIANFVSLKGRESNYAALSSVGQLYVWGANAKNLLNQKMTLPPTWNGNYIYEPVLQTDLIRYQILDYSIESNFIAVVIGEGSYERSEQDYWFLLKQKAKKQLNQTKMIGVSLKNSRIRNLRIKYNNSILSLNSVKTPKNNAHKSIQNTKRQGADNHLTQIQKVNLAKGQVPQFNKITTVPSKDYKFHTRQSSDQVLIKKNLIHKQFRNSEFNVLKSDVFKTQNKRFNKKAQKTFSKVYSIKLNEILQKKKKIETESIVTNLKKIDQNSIEYRLKKKQFQEVLKKHQKDENILKSTISKLLIKSYVVNALSSSVDEGRNIKIDHLARSFFFNRIQRMIRRLFVSTKVKFSLQRLRKQRLSRFFLLVVYFKRYVARFRTNKFESQRRTVVLQIIKGNIYNKIRKGIYFVKNKNDKLVELGQWMSYVRKQRKICLKQLWNNYMLTIFKFRDGYENTLNSGNRNITFSAFYQQKIDSHRALHLKQFMRKYSKREIFKCLEIQQKKSLVQTKKRSQLKVSQQIKDRSGFGYEVLPFSLHYNYFHHPKSLQINLGQIFRSSPIWIQTQRLLLDQTLNKIIANYDKLYVLYMRQYQIDLANFIKIRYNTFFEKRWRYIIEYNRVEKTYSKKKKQKELKRILDLVGMKRLVQQDCIPEKYLILQQALQRKDAPKAPDPYLSFDFDKFQLVFGRYWQDLNTRGKQLKKKLM